MRLLGCCSLAGVDPLRADALTIGEVPREVALATHLYGIAKAIAFCLLAIQHGLAVGGGGGLRPVASAAQLAAWVAGPVCGKSHPRAGGGPALVDGPLASERGYQIGPLQLRLVASMRRTPEGAWLRLR